jgi:hypothetical protein
MNEKQLAKLIRKTTQKAAAAKAKPRRAYDATLEVTKAPETDEDIERADFFAEMKKREF